MSANSVNFSPLAIARSRLVLTGLRGAVRDRVADLLRSLKDFEFFTADEAAPIRDARDPAEDATLAAARRWFWARKPGRGFAIAGFPRSGLEARVLDEWLEARDESLTACVAFAPAAAAVADFYRQRAQLLSIDASGSTGECVDEFAGKVGAFVADR